MRNARQTNLCSPQRGIRDRTAKTAGLGCAGSNEKGCRGVVQKPCILQKTCYSMKTPGGVLLEEWDTFPMVSPNPAKPPKAGDGWRGAAAEKHREPVALCRAREICLQLKSSWERREVIGSERFRDSTEDIDLNKNHWNGSSNRTLWVTWRRIRGSRAAALAHVEHFLAANTMLERGRGLHMGAGTGMGAGMRALQQGVRCTPGCLKSIASGLEARPAVTSRPVSSTAGSCGARRWMCVISASSGATVEVGFP